MQQPEAPNLLQYSTQGCEASCELAWTKIEISEAVNRGPHPSARTTDAISSLKKEPKEKYAKEPMQANIMGRGKR